jgi:hypothetical protein
VNTSTLSIEEVAAAIASSWQAASSNDPDNWSPENPSHGQCAVTALAVQELLGGDLLRADVHGVSHYWNRLRSGEELDLTRSQFPSFAPGPVAVRERDYVLGFPDTAYRYRLLWGLVVERLGRLRAESERRVAPPVHVEHS